MASEIVISKITNIIDFKIHESNYKKSVQRIKRMAGMWGKVTSQYDKAMQAGKRVAKGQGQSIKATTRAEIRQQRMRKQTLRADNIRFKDTLNNNKDIRAQLQRINSDFLKGNTSFKERSAQIGQLTKLYRNLNQQASKHNKISSIAGRVGSGIRGVASTGVGLAATGVGVIGAAGYSAHQGYNKVKDQGQQFEALLIQLQNTFGDRAGELSNTIRTMADKNGSPLLQLGNNLVEFVALMRPLGVSVDDAIKRFQQTQNSMQSYGIGGERAEGFQQQLTQALDQGTLDSFKEAFAWAPQLRADLLQYVKETMKVSQKDFLGGLTNGKYSLKETWFKFLSANESKYANMSSLYKSSSMANDSRASNQLSIAIYRIFESSGFKEAMAYTSRLLNRWGMFLENNAKQIGEVFGNLYKVTGELADGALKDLTAWLKSLTAEDIRSWFNDFKSGLQDLAFIIKTVATKLKAMFPDLVSSSPDAKGQYYVERERHWLNSGYDGQEAGRLAEGEMRRKFNLGFEVPTFNENLVQRWNVSPQPIASNFSGTLSLSVDAQVNHKGFSDLVDFKIDNYETKQINMIASGY